MSITDQAFIRAYGETVRSNRAAASGSRAPTASAEMIDGILSQSGGNWQNQQRLEVGLNQASWTVHPASIDVGLDSAIPAPHFVRHRAAPVAAATAAAVALGSMSPNSNRESNLGRQQIALGRSTNAPPPAFTSSEFENTKHSTPKPAFEIDAVCWPEICHTLLAQCANSFSKLADDLRQEAAEGRKVLAVTGVSRGEGRTTFTLCLAKQLAATRIRVAVVDADFASPSMARRLNIGAEAGWEAAICGEQSVWDVMIEASNDRLSIVPLSADYDSEAMPRPVYGIAAVLGELAEQFDLVIVDAGPLLVDEAADWLLDPGAGVQGAIVAHDARRNHPHRLAAASLQLAEAGIRQLGFAEMFKSGSET